MGASAPLVVLVKSSRRLDDDEPANTVIRVRLTAGQRLKLTRVAGENGTDLSGVIREAVNVYCDDYLEQPTSPVFRRTTRGRRPHNVAMATDPNPNPNPTPRPPQQPNPPGPSQPPNTPDTGTNLPKR